MSNRQNSVKEFYLSNGEQTGPTDDNSYIAHPPIPASGKPKYRVDLRDQSGTPDNFKPRPQSKIDLMSIISDVKLRPHLVNPDRLAKLEDADAFSSHRD